MTQAKTDSTQDLDIVFFKDLCESSTDALAVVSISGEVKYANHAFLRLFSIKKIPSGLLITFPAEFEYEEIEGTISFKRLSNQSIDFVLPIDLEAHQYLLVDEKLVDGRWDIKIEWMAQGGSYLFKQKIIY